MAYTAGTHVRYGGTGICLIERVEEVSYPGQSAPRLCYILRPIRNQSMEVTVPLDNAALCAKMRPLLTKEEVDAMLDKAAADDDADAIEWIEERKQRHAEFKKILAGGDAQTLLRLIRCILKQRAALAENRKHLSSADDNTRKDAERMLDDEFAFSLGITPEEAGVYICDRLQVNAGDRPEK